RYAELSDLADKSYDVLRKAAAPSGLLYDVVQPEMKTMYFQRDLSYFSPNDIIQLNNACTTAATVARHDPGVSRQVLHFIRTRSDRLCVQYYGRTGERAWDLRISAPELAAIARLAALLEDREMTTL